MLGIVTKQPADILDYDIDFSDWIADDDLITNGTVTIDPTGALISNTVQIHSPTVKVWLAGGTNNSTYKVTLLASTRQGRVKEVEFKVRVREY